MVTMRNATGVLTGGRRKVQPLTVHVPNLKVEAVTIHNDEPDVLRVTALDMSVSSHPEIWPMEKWGEVPSEVRRLLRYASWSDMASQPFPPEAFEEFIGTKKTPALDASSFVRKYGKFRTDVPCIDDIPEPGKLKFSVSVSEYEREQKWLRTLLEMHGKLRGTEPDISAARELAKQNQLPYAEDPSKALWYAISAQLHQGNVSLALEASTGGLRMVLKCGDLLTGLYARIWGSFLTNEYWAACPQCGFVFSGTKQQIFCSLRCGRNFKQKRYRKRKEALPKTSASVVIGKHRRSLRQKRGQQ